MLRVTVPLYPGESPLVAHEMDYSLKGLVATLLRSARMPVSPGPRDVFVSPPAICTAVSALMLASADPVQVVRPFLIHYASSMAHIPISWVNPIGVSHSPSCLFCVEVPDWSFVPTISA